MSQLARKLLGTGVILDGFPDIEDIAITPFSANNPAIDLPSGIVVGERLLAMLVSNAGGGGISWPAGWSEIYEDNSGPNLKAGWATRIADGSEGATITVTHSGSGLSGVAAVLRISEANAAALDLSSSFEGTTGNPNVGAVVMTGGSQNGMAFVAVARRNTVLPTSFPAGYDLNQTSCLGAGNSLHFAAKKFIGTGDDPGAFSFSTSENTLGKATCVRAS